MKAITATALLCCATQFCRAEDPQAANKDADVVAKLVDQLAGKLANRDKAAGEIEELPYTDLPLLREQAKRDDLSGDQQRRLERVLARMEARVKLADARKKRLAPMMLSRGKIAAEFYDKGQHTNPAWDENVRLVFKLDSGDRTGLPLEDAKARRDRMTKAVDAALAAGCDDPDFLCIAGIYKSSATDVEGEGFPLTRRALDDAARGSMSPVCAVIVIGDVLRARAAGRDGGLDRKNLEPAERLLSEMLVRYKQVCNRDDIPRELVIALASDMFKTAHEIHGDMRPLIKNVVPPLEKAAPDDARALSVKAQAYIWAAWQARGGDWAANVTQQGWKDFADDLEVANQTLRKAWDLDPNDAEAPTKMLTVALGEEWPRAEVDKWYQRAMAINPDNKEAMAAMIYYLEPKWHGSPEEMVQFGRECFETRNWHSDIAFELVSAHTLVASQFPDPSWYYHHNVVWMDINSVYTAFLQLHPTNTWVMNRYARFACLCGQWKKANELFAQLGDKVDARVYTSEAEYKQLRAELAGHAHDDQPATQP